MRLQACAVSGLAAALLGSTGCVVGGAAFRERDTVVEVRRLESGGVFRVENTNGHVELDTWADARVRIEADKAAGSVTALQDIRVTIAGEGGRVDVTTRTPEGGMFGPGAQVDYRVTVPETARVEIETVNGRVEVRGLRGALRARTVNGSVVVEEAHGAVDAGTVNGSIRIEHLRVAEGTRNRASTTSGSITLRLPSDASGDIAARTVNGGITTDFPLEVSGRRRGKWLEGRLGQGGARFELETVNGAIRIRQN